MYGRELTLILDLTLKPNSHLRLKRGELSNLANVNYKDPIRVEETANANTSVQCWELKLLNFSAFIVKYNGWVRTCEWQQGITFLITFYKNISDKMFTSAASENGAVWMNLLLFPLNWRLFTNVLVASVHPAFRNRRVNSCIKVNPHPCNRL